MEGGQEGGSLPSGKTGRGAFPQAGLSRERRIARVRGHAGSRPRWARPAGHPDPETVPLSAGPAVGGRGGGPGRKAGGQEVRDGPESGGESRRPGRGREAGG